MPNSLCSTFAIGARQLVVQEALDIILCLVISNVSSLTPIHTVISGSFAGAEIITHLTPASRCFEADALPVNIPVDSITISTSRSLHGIFSGSVLAKIFIFFPSTVIPSSVARTVESKIPCTESYLSRCARVWASVRSFIATISKSLYPLHDLRKFLPILPKPFIATRNDMRTSLKKYF